MDPRPRAAVVTISDGVTHGTREDASGDLASVALAGTGHEGQSALEDVRNDLVGAGHDQAA